MTENRLKFRVYDIRHKKYFNEPDPTPPLNNDGTLGFTCGKPDFQKYYIIEFCTGFSDKNGKLIHDGDVVIKRDINALGYGRIRKCFVHYNNEWAAWAITTQYDDTYPLSGFEPEAYEIIGTIHDTDIKNDDR